MNHEDGADEDRKDQSVATITKKSSEGKEIYGKLYGARVGRVANAIENNDESENALAVDFRSHLFFLHLPVHCVLHFLSFTLSLFSFTIEQYIPSASRQSAHSRREYSTVYHLNS